MLRTPEFPGGVYANSTDVPTDLRLRSRALASWRVLPAKFSEPARSLDSREGSLLSHGSNREALVAARENYARWVSSAHTGAHSRRTAERNAAFFIPHLKPGMSLLDGGCGPGSITLGLAAIVAPGRVTGVDLNSESLKIARQAAAERGTEN